MRSSVARHCGVSILAVALVSVAVPPGAAAIPVTPDAPLAGTVIFLDPGHQGTGHEENLAAQVDDGRGGTKDCQTSGMTALGGTPEHTIVWDVSQLVASRLESLGAEIVLSRPDDTGWGGCITDRARAASASGAAVAVSVHADSTSLRSDDAHHGFHVIVPALPVPSADVDEVQSGEGRRASTAMRDAYERAGFTPANYAGVDGLQVRSDVAAPALTTVPVVFLEMGNGSNPSDAAELESAEGRASHAAAIATGIVDFVAGRPEAGR
ncbi:N-acetylmuramoyl-L-alanine amidase [Rhodococcus sp. BP-316]|jgi:N-acetylmuramoyl-L-alanine amidase|uniref:N-acetylmuramoyl-L-alanine amidase n=1 Tax=unclassified Rhodococcus (in: high G+C Gram-positive bacteria) TaxID=192944 RepID=UPI001C9ADA92|nr:N-acetylmuramoyl-L-alanine amidase [Rhodococcus sp. BP-316]